MKFVFMLKIFQAHEGTLEYTSRDAHNGEFIYE